MATSSVPACVGCVQLVVMVSCELAVLAANWRRARTAPLTVTVAALLLVLQAFDTRTQYDLVAASDGVVKEALLVPTGVVVAVGPRTRVAHGPVPPATTLSVAVSHSDRGGGGWVEIVGGCKAYGVGDCACLRSCHPDPYSWWPGVTVNELLFVPTCVVGDGAVPIPRYVAVRSRRRLPSAWSAVRR